MILEDWAEPVPEGVNVLVSGEVLFAPAVFVDKLMKDGYIDFLKEYAARKKKEVAHHGEEPENA